MGNYQETAATYAGIAVGTFYRWMEMGLNQKEGKYREFYDAVKKAESDAEVRDIALIEKDESWQSKAWRLERKHFERWGRKEHFEHTGPIGGPLEIIYVPAIKRETPNQ